MNKFAWLGMSIGGITLWFGGNLAWVATAPAVAFAQNDFVRPSDPTMAEREAMFGICMSNVPRTMSPDRQLSVCRCQKDLLAKQLNRAEYVYLVHMSLEEMRQANSVMKGLVAAKRPQEELVNLGKRGAAAVRDSAGTCLQSSLTDDDVSRIRRRLEQRGIAPSSGTNEVTDE